MVQGFWREQLTKALRDQPGRLVLWMPVPLAAGIGIYFALPEEPGAWDCAGLAVIASILVWAAVRTRATALKVALIALVLVAAGMGAAKVRVETTGWQATPADRQFSRLEGRVRSVDPFPDGLRIVVDRIDLAGRPAFDTPGRVRLRLRGTQPDLVPGDWISGTVRLLAPSRPLTPGGFDFQRHAYFQRLGAVGFALGPVERLSGAPEPRWSDAGVKLDALRLEVTSRIQMHLPGADGAIAAALLTGHRTAVPEPVLEDVRRAGLAHLLAISGLHIGLVGGLIFFAVRLGLALTPRVRTRADTKKIAAVVALSGAVFYALLAGATVPTLRAVLVLGIVLAAVMLDRRGFSLRTLALAAVAVLLFMPESLLGPSFQMSFAAAFALVAAYDAVWRDRDPNPARAGAADPSLPVRVVRGVLRYGAGVLLTTLIAGAATWPFVVYHFNVTANFGILANLAAVPIAALWVMPAGLLSLLAMPMGLEGPLLAVMGQGITLILSVAHWAANLPWATSALGASPAWAPVCLALGGLWLGIWRGPVRWAGLPAVCVAMAGLGSLAPADVFISENGRLVAFRDGTSGYQLSSLRAARRDREELLERAGTVPGEVWQADGVLRGGLRCGPAGCTYHTNGGPGLANRAEDSAVVSLALDRVGITEDCGRVALLITLVPAKRLCPGDRNQRIIDLWDIKTHGAHAVYVTRSDAGGTAPRVRIERVEDYRADRPWVVRPR